MKNARTSARLRRLLVLPLALCAFALGTGQASAALPVGGVGQAITNFVVSPNAVAGANDWKCKPSAAHSTPVVLVHATFVNLGTNWAALSPTLKNAGYCVYAFNYGMTWLSGNRIGGLGDIAQSAGTLKAFVDKVLSSTGAQKVDLVGHSQGGMMPNYYIKRLGGAPKVRTFVGIAPSNHGTTVAGLLNLADALGFLGTVIHNSIDAILNTVGVPGLTQQESTSTFQKQLFADGDTVPGPRYAVIETNKDIVVTPYTNAFLSGPNVTNILIQAQCPKDNVGHIGMFADSVVIQNVVNQLGANAANFKPTCGGYGLPL